MGTTAIYVRVSTKAQDTRSQEPDLKKWAEAFGGGEVEWYRDKASGKTMDRPEWNRLEQDIRTGKVSTIAIWRLDRLGRTASGLTSLFDDLQVRKVNLVSIRDGLDLSTSAGRLMANVLASVAQYENEVRGERVRAGQAKAKAQGKRWGGSKAGVRKKVDATKERLILQLKEQGESVSSIARNLHLSRPTIYSVLNGNA